MCKFCEDKECEVICDVRSCFADQNIEAINGEGSEWDGKHRMISNEYFKLRSFEGNCISIEYRMETDDGITINPFSENVVAPFMKDIKWNFCPFCGRQLVENIKRDK